MKEVYLLAQEHCGLKVGDSVKVTRVAENNEGGWPNSWYIEKDKYIGETGKIIKITPSMGICVQFGNDPNRADMAWYFPYFVLEKTTKPAHEFKPFDKVLVRDNNYCRWTIDFYAYHIADSLFPYKTLAGGYCQCIPYEGNEHLVGTTDNPEE